jgi:nucleotide-binding universal stress UspA family protein
MRGRTFVVWEENCARAPNYVLAAKSRAGRPKTLDAKRVVIAVDGSEYSDNAVEYARDLLVMFDDATAYVVHVVPIYSLYIDGMLESGFVGQSQIQKASEERGKSILEEAEQTLEEAEIPVKPILCEGDIVGEILRVIDDVNADLVVVGNRGLSEVGSMVLGSISHKLVHEAKCPVLLVKDKKLEEKREELNEES